MDKTKSYKIINTLDKEGNISKYAKHYIGRTGKFLRLIKGMRFEFFSEELRDCLHSSTVVNIEDEGSLLKVHTLNTVYSFRMID